ncbi:hypothetical protein K8942_05365 [Candidatus Peribacteria bacterium]|nr:MAG: hypothetical protein K8942_05365 [Candidatus Peribacteria bacterium]
MPSVFTLIGNAWAFAKKQSVLMQVAIWLMFLPMIGMNELSSFMADPALKMDAANGAPILLSALFILILSVILVWGIACVLLIGSRQLGSSSGRSRTSFSAVRTEARRFLIPLILTGILRNIITFLWALLLIVPGVIYSVRTAFYSIILIEEGISYRPALQKSKAIVKGHTWQLFIKLFLLGIILFAPIRILDGFGINMPTSMSLTILNVLSAAFTTLSTVLYTLCTIEMYGHMKPATKPVTGGGKKAVKKVATKKK